MNKNIRIQEMKSILHFYHCKIPKNIHFMKKKANKIIIQKLCVSNCDKHDKYKRIFFILNKKRMLSHQKKVKYDKTKKRKYYPHKQTRVQSPVSDFLF
jgi:hypothetical protein